MVNGISGTSAQQIQNLQITQPASSGSGAKSSGSVEQGQDTVQLSAAAKAALKSDPDHDGD